MSRFGERSAQVSRLEVLLIRVVVRIYILKKGRICRRAPIVFLKRKAFPAPSRVRLFLLESLLLVMARPLARPPIYPRNCARRKTARKEIALGVARTKYKRLEADMFRGRIELADTLSEMEKDNQRHEIEMERAEEQTKELEVALRAADEVNKNTGYLDAVYYLKA